MRVLRTSHFIGMHEPPTTIVQRESDMTCTIEELVTEMSAMEQDTFVIWDVWEIDEAEDFTDVLNAALRRMEDRMMVEQNMAVLYYYSARCLPMVREDGLLSCPSPLDGEDIRSVLNQLAEHSVYKGQHISVFDKDGNKVEMKNGTPV